VSTSNKIVVLKCVVLVVFHDVEVLLVVDVLCEVLNVVVVLLLVL
jgi:hypothetical protein